MNNRDEEFLSQLNETFRVEADEHLDTFSRGIIDLEKKLPAGRYAEIIETLFREIHSLKGAARSIDKREVESICQPLENIFSLLKRRELSLSPSAINLFYQTVETLTKLVKESGPTQNIADRENHRELIRNLIAITTSSSSTDKNVETQNIIGYSEPEPLHEGVEVSVTESENSPVFDSFDSVRISILKLDRLLFQAEEFIQVKKALSQRLYELHEINNCPDSRKLSGQLADFTRAMERDRYDVDYMIDNHLETMRQLLVVPISSMVLSFPRMVRKIASEQNKEIEFVIRGEEMEIDKRILEEIKDPLVHLIRNSIDHGIGTPNDRIRLKKLSRGTIMLEFSARESGMIEITLSDDGEGINREKLVIAAVKSGILSAEAAAKLNPVDILPLIYQSGVSTSLVISDLSGWGLGLTIVNEKVEKLNGRISVESEPGKGTTFHILLPMSLATIRGVLIRSGESLFILPIVNVERVIMVDPKEIKTVENHETILIDKRIISVVDLGDVLELPIQKHAVSPGSETGSSDLEKIRLVIVVSGDTHIAFKVTEVGNEQQVLVKSLGKLLKRVKNVSGATILGSGKVVPVLLPADLIKSAFISSKRIKAVVPTENKRDVIKKILVADDSITSRTLIKNILETAGYEVATAIDGKDAFTIAHNNDFDLIVSDVDMPGMNGFELISRIKQNKKLSNIPVVLVTALGSREDRERGVEVGADAYIVKSSFDQNNLLEVIKKLI